MRDWIRDHMPSVQTYLTFVSGYSVAVFLVIFYQFAIGQGSGPIGILLGMGLCALVIIPLVLYIVTDRQSPHYRKPAHDNPLDIDLTW